MYIVLIKDWAKALLQRMTFVKTRATTSKSKSLVKIFEELWVEFLQQVVTTVEIPPEMIMNWDHTGIHLVPHHHGWWKREDRDVSSWLASMTSEWSQLSSVVRSRATSFPFRLSIRVRRQSAIQCTSSLKNGTLHSHPGIGLQRRLWGIYLNHIIFPYVDAVHDANGLNADSPALAIGPSDSWHHATTWGAQYPCCEATPPPTAPIIFSLWT